MLIIFIKIVNSLDNSSLAHLTKNLYSRPTSRHGLLYKTPDCELVPVFSTGLMGATLHISTVRLHLLLKRWNFTGYYAIENRGELLLSPLQLLALAYENLTTLMEPSKGL